jgi:hypothetical protein
MPKQKKLYGFPQKIFSRNGTEGINFDHFSLEKFVLNGFITLAPDMTKTLVGLAPNFKFVF